MACGGCGRSKKLKNPVAPAASMAANSAASAGENGMFKVEYLGPATQFQRIKTSRRGYYRFGGEPESPTRFFFVYPEDVDKFERNVRFKVHSQPAAGEAALASAPPLKAETPSPPAPKTPEQAIQAAEDQDDSPIEEGTAEFYASGLEKIGLSAATASVLVSNDILLPNDLTGLPDSYFLSLKGIGPARLEEIKDAIRRLGVRTG